MSKNVAVIVCAAGPGSRFGGKRKKQFVEVSGRAVPYEVVARRPGDIAACWADPTLAHELMNWRATRDLAQMCQDSWRWQSSNPDGYE